MVAGVFKRIFKFFLGFFLILFAGKFSVFFHQDFLKGNHIKTAGPRLPKLF